jgi:hypothetical protein
MTKVYWIFFNNLNNELINSYFEAEDNLQSQLDIDWTFLQPHASQIDPELVEGVGASL